LEYVERLYPADHYVLIDDKLHILTAVKKIWSERVTTIFAKQGHYAFDPKILAENPSADVELAKISDLLNCDFAALLQKQEARAMAEKPAEVTTSTAAAPTAGAAGVAEFRAILIVAGVSGSGKTTIATALAQRLGLPFTEGSKLYPPPDVAKMHSAHQ